MSQPSTPSKTNTKEDWFFTHRQQHRIEAKRRAQQERQWTLLAGPRKWLALGLALFCMMSFSKPILAAYWKAEAFVTIIVNQLGPSTPTAVLQETAHNPNNKVMTTSIQQLESRARKSAAARTVLIGLLRSQTTNTRYFSTLAVSRLNLKESSPTLRKQLLVESHPLVRSVMFQTLKRWNRFNVEVLVDQIKRQEPFTLALEAGTALAAKGKEALPALRKMIASSFSKQEQEISRHAMLILNRIKREETLPLYETLLKHKDPWIRRKVVHGLYSMKTQESMRFLLALCAHDDRLIRGEAKAFVRMSQIKP